MNRLGEAAVEELGSEISRWRYARPELAVGIVHLGLGAFARAHLLAFTDDALERAFGPFGVCGVSLRNPGVRDHLLPQDGLYALAERGGDAERLRVIGCLREILVGPEDPTAVVRRIADPAVGLVTLTVTENGYCHDPASGGLQPEHPDIRQDLEHPGRPRSAIGALVAGLDARRHAGAPPPTVLSCDNLPSNGTTLRDLALAFAALRDDALTGWIDAEVAFPCTMVDRIVPATTPAEVEKISARLRLRDEAPVVCEAFRQWVIEDRFTGPRPTWERVGAELVADVAPYEEMKLRLLNGSHSALAYLGFLAGFEHVFEVMREAAFVAFLRRMMAEEVAPTLSVPADLAAYSPRSWSASPTRRSPIAPHRSPWTARRSCPSGCSVRSATSCAPAVRSACSVSRSPAGCATPPAATRPAGRSRWPIPWHRVFPTSPPAPAASPRLSRKVSCRCVRCSATSCRATSASPARSRVGSPPFSSAARVPR